MKKVYWISHLEESSIVRVKNNGNLEIDDRYGCNGGRAEKTASVLVPLLIKKDIQLINIFLGKDLFGKNQQSPKDILLLAKGACENYCTEVAEILDKYELADWNNPKYGEYCDSAAKYLEFYNYNANYPNKLSQPLETEQILAKLDKIIDSSEPYKVVNQFCFEFNKDIPYYNYNLSTAIHNFITNEKKSECLTGGYVNYWKFLDSKKEWIKLYNENYPNNPISNDIDFYHFSSLVEDEYEIYNEEDYKGYNKLVKTLLKF